MVEAGSVSALLKLDASNFDTSMANSAKKLSDFANTMMKVGKSGDNFAEGLNKVTTEIEHIRSQLKALDSISTFESFNRLSTSMKNLVDAAIRFNKEGNVTVTTFAELGRGIQAFMNAVGGVELKLTNVINTERQLNATNREVASSSQQATQGVRQYETALSSPAPRTFISTNQGVSVSLGTTTSSAIRAANALERYNISLSSSGTTGLANISGAAAELAQRMVNYANLATKAWAGFGTTFDYGLNSIRTTLTETVSMMKYLESSMQSFGANISAGLNSTITPFQNVTREIGTIAPAMNTTSASATNMTSNISKIPVVMNGAYSSFKPFNSTVDSTNNIMKSFKSSTDSASSGANRMNTATRGLTGTLNTLRTTVGMVASMFLFNFAHNMMISVKNTVAAKSEMMSYLHTMGMTQNQINSFNSALDQTAERFQRINKYNIGETVANIGLEFDLSAKEMEKAMSVTSMITSEYLRAGRNADEAALAVKDIMQGQFQRLSRETGVKGEDLKKAGWSGDNEDVLGLMNALEKVAQSRHWDVFAEKANSLNDIVLITQNRLSEWATDMTENLTPIVTQSFNLLVAGITGFTTVLGQIGEALHLPDWTGTAVMVGGLALALSGLVTSTITARTGLGLLDIAHKGLGQSIIATIFNIDKEALANQKATTVAMGKVLGLNAQAVAERGLAGAIAQSMTQQELENIAKTQSNVISAETTIMRRAENLAKQEGILLGEALVFAQNEENLSNMRSITLLTAKALGLNMTTLAQEGFIIALGQRIALSPIYQAFLSEETAKNLGLAGAIGITMSALLPLIAVLGALAIAVGSWVVEVNNACQKMGEFNTLIKDGDNMIKDAKATTESYKGTVKKLNEELESGTLTEEQARQKKVELAEASQMVRFAEDEEKDTIEAVQRARSSQAKSEESRVKTATKSHGDMIELVRQLGYEYDQAADKANKFGNALDHGTRIEQELANHEEWNRGRTYDYLKDYDEKAKGKWSDEDIIKRNSEYKDIIQAQNREYAKMLTADGLGGYLEGLAGWKWNQGIEEMMKIQDYFNTGDFLSALDTFSHGIGEVLPLSQLMQQVFGEPQDMLHLGEQFNNLNQWITDGLNNFNSMDIGKVFSDFGNNIVQGIFTPLNNIGENLHEVVSGVWNQITETFSNLFSGGEGGGGGLLPQKIDTSWLLKGLFGFIDSTGISEWFTNDVLSPIQEFLSTIDIASLLTTSGVDMFGALLNMIFGEGTYEKINTYIQTTIIAPLMNLPIAIQGYLTMAVGNFVGFANQLLQQGMSAGSNFLNGVVNFISQLPSRVYSYITSTASNIISGASQWVSNARSKASETVNAVITQVSQLPDKVYNEFMKIANRIRDAISAAVQAATQFGSDIVNAVLGALHIASPGIIQEKIATEFANIGGRIAETREDAQNEASLYGQSIVDGMDTQIANIQASASMYSTAMAQVQPMTDGSFVESYESDAYALYGINQTMATDTSMTFGLMGDTVNSTISGISLNMQTSFADMNTTQTTALTTMQNQNRTAYTNLQNQTTTSLNNMRSTTQNVTVQMINAWSHMKDSIISSADQLKTQSTAHFNALSSNIGSFYQKLQNPSMWGAGDKVPTRYYNHSRGQRGIRAVKQVFGVTPNSGVAGGPMQGLPQKTSLRNLRSIIGSPFLFRGMDLDQEVDVAQFLSMFDGAFGWNDWHNPHFEHIKSTTGEWDMRGPMIMHRIDTGTAFKVKEFYNSQPQISFASFQKMAEALFSAIPYDYYFDSSKYGSWQAALQAGSCNCYDGANALVALANTCGFSGHIEHGTWNGIGHVYAVIEGKKMDTTGWQQRRDWNGVSAGSPPNMRSGESKTYNITIDMNNATFYGEDDFRSKMEDIAEEVLRKEVNTSITVGI